MGSDNRAHYIGEREVVSIHAPAWGATRSESRFTTEPKVSIHAPAWGATGYNAKW